MIIDKGNLTIEYIDSIASLENKSVLEIGCGDGRLSHMLYDRAEQLTAVDPDDKSLAVASSRFPYIDFRTGSGESLRALTSSYDVVLFTLSLHHQNSVLALEQTEIVLNDNGMIVIVEPAVDSEVSIICNVFNDETAVLKDAVWAVIESSLVVASVENVETFWEFSDPDELYDWLFEFHQHPDDPVIISQVSRLLGSRIDDRPLVLSDKLLFITLERSG